MDNIIHIQGDEASTLTPLFLVHAISGLALPYLGLGSLSDESDQFSGSRPVYGVSSPIYGHKDYKLPSSLEDVARQYISFIQREVQPEGPYILGGWSLGGTIALKMASILESRGESVLHVIMIDSPNPELYPAFINRHEQETIASMTYNRVAGRYNAVLADDDGGSGSESTDDEEDSHSSLATILPPPALRDARRDFVQKTFQDERMGWQTARFKQFRTVRFRAQHDSAFDPTHIGELTVILGDVLGKIP
ncbi:aspyridones efflux protein apdF [Physcia stellaris]|nr:aspyridones efflux protein apdF [Physcia stellaris]